MDRKQALRGETKGATPFLTVVAKPSMMFRSMLVQCKGVDGQAAIKETVESLCRLGYPELTLRPNNEPGMRAFRDALSKGWEKRRWGVVAIAQAAPKKILRLLA